MIRSFGKQGGFATLELAVWSAVFLPVLVGLIALMGVAHDNNVVHTIPGAVMREMQGRTMFWRGTGLAVDRNVLRTKLEELSARAQQEATQQTNTLQNIAARACAWVYRINSVTGVVIGNPVVTDCIDDNPLGANVLAANVFEAPLRGYINTVSRATTNQVSGRFMPMLVVFGVAVGGSYNGFLGSIFSTGAQHAEAWVPREGVTL